MSFWQWVLVNIPETFVVLVFLSHSLKVKVNILYPLIIFVLVMSTTKTYITNDANIGLVIAFVIYIFSFIKHAKFVKLFKKLGFILMVIIVVDCAWILFLFIVSSRKITEIQTDYASFFVSVIYAAIIKSLVLYLIYNIRRNKK
jgi:hypothetical protein